jgi:hypothetical protein
LLVKLTEIKWDIVNFFSRCVTENAIIVWRQGLRNSTPPTPMH